MNLAALFGRYNAIYFGGRLPRYTIRRRLTFRQRVDPNTGDDREMIGHCDRRRRSIYIRQGLPPRMVRACLIHEMTHIRQLGHSTRFFSILLDLAAAGCRPAVDAIRNEVDYPRRKVLKCVAWHKAHFPGGQIIRRVA